MRRKIEGEIEEGGDGGEGCEGGGEEDGWGNGEGGERREGARRIRRRNRRRRSGYWESRKKAKILSAHLVHCFGVSLNPLPKQVFFSNFFLKEW